MDVNEKGGSSLCFLDRNRKKYDNRFKYIKRIYDILSKDNTKTEPIKEQTSGEYTPPETYEEPVTFQADSVREEIKLQNAKAAKLPFKQRVSHFWSYYKVPFFIMLAVGAFAAYLVLHYTLLAPKPYSFSAYALNSAYVKDITSDDERAIDRFLQEFAEKEGLNLKETRAEINCELTVNPGSGDNLDLANDVNITATGQAGEIDLLFGSGELIDYYVPGGFYSETIDHYLPADFYEYLSERNLIYYYKDPADGTEYAVGVCLRDAKRMPETGLYEGTDIDPVVAIVSYYTPRMDTAVDFIEYLFDYPNCLEAE